MATALEELMMVKAFLSKLQQPEKQLKEIKDNLRSECAVVTDCKALYDCVKRETIQQATDKRVAIEALVIKDLLKDMSCQFRWISSERQLADGLTKVGARQSFVERYKGGHVQLVADESYTASKKKTKEERQRTLQETRGSRSTAAQVLIACAMAEAATKAEAKEDAEGLNEKDWMIIITVMVLIVTTLIFAGTKMWKMVKSLTGGTDHEKMKKENENLKAELDRLGHEFDEMNYLDGEKTMRIEKLEKSYAELDGICTHQLRVERDRIEMLDGMLQQAERERDRLQLEVTRLQQTQVPQGEIVVAPYGRCWHASTECGHLNQTYKVRVLRPCSACSHGS